MTVSSPRSNDVGRWEAVSQLRPQLKPHITVTRHRFRGEVSYILEDTITKTRYRFSQTAYEIVGRLTGRHRVEEIYTYLQKKKGPYTTNKKTIAETIIQLSRMEALKGDSLQQLLSPLATKKKVNSHKLFDQLKNSPLFLKIPLFNPSSILTRHRDIAHVFFNKRFLSFFLCLLLAAGGVLLLNWPELSHNSLDRIFTQHNLIILWLLYPLVKAIHEFAHGFSVTYFGGDVTEMGLMLLLFVPVPYINASDSSNFSRKWQRIAVAGAGIIAELVLASIALLLWSVIEPGILRTIAFNTLLICGVSTLIFNGNPLVRYDGYYILSDLMEIPNLAARSSSYLWYCISRYLPGTNTVTPLKASKAEKRWFIFYGICAFFYRLTIYSSIFYFFASKLGPIGAVIGILGIGQLVFIPLRKRLHSNPGPKGLPVHRRKLTMLILFFVTVVVVILTLVPLPHTTQSEGVVWLPEENLVKMKTNGIVTHMEVASGDMVKKGEVLFFCEDIELQHAILLLESQIEELRLQESAAFAQNPLEAKIIAEKRLDLKKRLEDKKRQEQDLIIASPHTGYFIVQQPGELTGTFFNQGESIGFIQNSATIVRTLISQEDIDLITQDLLFIHVFLATDPSKTFTATLHSENPHPTFKLPSRTLSTTGGGKIITNPEDKAHLTTIEEMFQLDIEIKPPIHTPFPEGRAYIRFSHGHESLLFRWSRRIQQLFITQFRG